MTESQLVPLDAMANRAVQTAVQNRLKESETPDPLAEFQKVIGGGPARTAASMIPAPATKAKRVTDARSSEALQRAALALMESGASELPPEQAVMKAMERAGINRAMLPQLLESDDWAGTVAKFCQQYLYVTHMPKLVAAQIGKGLLGDTGAFKALGEMFGKNESTYDEQTKALADATPETRLRHTEALIEDLQRSVAEARGQGANPASVEQARSAAIAEANVRRKQAR